MTEAEGEEMGVFYRRMETFLRTWRSGGPPDFGDLLCFFFFLQNCVIVFTHEFWG